MIEPTVNTPSPRFAELEDKRRLCRDLMGGTKAMIAAGETWMIKYEAESTTSYQNRLKRNILTNFLSQAVGKASGKIFSKPIKYKEDVPEEIKEICKNIDKQDRTLDSFLLDATKKALADGISYILIDTPEAKNVVTRADEKAKNIRPYAVLIEAKNLLEVMVEMIDGKEVITRIRVLECVQVPNGPWGYVHIDQVRVLRRILVPDTSSPDGVKPAIQFELYRENDKKEWIIFKEGMTTFSEIALIAVYANRCGFYEGEPVFQETAELNLEHWRSKGDQLYALSFGRFAMLGGSGVLEDENKPIEVGPAKKLFSSNEQSKFYYVESDGTGLEHGWKHLERIEKSIETASAQLRIEDKGKVTATAAALESDETNSGLKAVVGGIEQSVQKMLQFFADQMGLDKPGGSVELNSNFGSPKGTDTGLQEITKLAVAGKISGKKALENLLWRGELQPDFNFEENTKEIATEPKTEPAGKKVANTGGA